MATAYTLTLDVGELNRVALSAAQREVTDTTRRVLNRATALTPVDTGTLRDHNFMRVQIRGHTAVGTIFNETEYARAVHDGSRAYVIRPKTKKALRFIIDGEVVFAAKVTMPARRGRPWMLRALKEIAIPAGYRMQSP